MGYTAKILDDIRAQIQPDDLVVKEARKRRDAVRGAVETAFSTVRTFGSGSLAHATAICPIHQRDKGLDADCGCVLDPRAFPTLGPESATGAGPRKIVEKVRDAVLSSLRKGDYPAAKARLTKRAILIEFHSPLPNGEDPTVDLIVALPRQAGGLWIPHLERNSWDPSDPETHTRLLTAPPKDLRVARARTIRLAKAENKRTDPAPLCSFNIEALAWMYVKAGTDVSQALLTLWRLGAADLRSRLTPDPAGASGPIKVPNRQEAAARFEHAASCLEAALANDEDEARVRAALRPLWPDFVAERAGQVTKARAAASLQVGQPLRSAAGVGLSTTAGIAHKAVRSFGHGSGRAH